MEQNRLYESLQQEKQAQIIYTTVKDIILEEVIKNLLSAQRAASERGDAKSVVSITKYLLKIAEQFKDVMIDISPKSNK